MTVGELKKQLANWPDEAEVRVEDDAGMIGNAAGVFICPEWHVGNIPDALIGCVGGDLVKVLRKPLHAKEDR